MPNGIYTAEGFLDDDGLHKGQPLVIKVAVTILGSKLTVDFSGSAPQMLGWG